LLVVPPEFPRACERQLTGRGLGRSAVLVQYCLSETGPGRLGLLGEGLELFDAAGGVGDRSEHEAGERGQPSE
ncbi:hypothetical protein O7047_22285, partial [Pseudenterobacter timonensis]